MKNQEMYKKQETIKPVYTRGIKIFNYIVNTVKNLETVPSYVHQEKITEYDVNYNIEMRNYFSNVFFYLKSKTQIYKNRKYVNHIINCFCNSVLTIEYGNHDPITESILVTSLDMYFNSPLNFINDSNNHSLIKVLDEKKSLRNGELTKITGYMNTFTETKQIGYTYDPLTERGQPVLKTITYNRPEKYWV